MFLIWACCKTRTKIKKRFQTGQHMYVPCSDMYEFNIKCMYIVCTMHVHCSYKYAFKIVCIYMVCTLYIRVHTCLDLPLVLDTRCLRVSPQQNFADLVQNAMCLFEILLGLLPSYQRGFSEGFQEDQSLSAAIQASLTLECLTGETRYSNPCTE